MEFLIRDIWDYINGAITCAMKDPAATLLVLMLLALVIITPGRKASEKLLLALAIGFIYLILTSNVLARTYVFEKRRYSFELFTGELYEMTENVLLFIPLGMLMCAIDLKTRPVRPWNDRRAYKVVRFFTSMAFSVVFSCVIELLQFFLRVGVFTLDDILCNTTGAFLGYTLIFLTVMIVVRVRKRKAQTQTG